MGGGGTYVLSTITVLNGEISRPALAGLASVAGLLSKAQSPAQSVRGHG